MNICLFEKEELNQPLSSRDERGEHILKVLHKNPGDTFDAGIIGGKAGLATITKIEKIETKNGPKSDIFFDFVPFDDEDPKSEGKNLYPVTLIVGFPRPIQLRRLLRDVSGLGAKKIILCVSDLGEKSYLKSNIISDGSAYKMLVDGSAQAASTHIPELLVADSLEKAMAMAEDNFTSGNNKNTIKICLDNVDAADSLGNYLEKSLSQKKSAAETACKPEAELKASDTQIIAAIGSERGWSKRERNIFGSLNWIRCSMGKRILRTETAVTVALSLILEKLGFLD